MYKNNSIFFRHIIYDLGYIYYQGNSYYLGNKYNLGYDLLPRSWFITKVMIYYRG